MPRPVEVSAEPKGQQMGNPDGYDYLVVGGGSAGSIVAARLAEDPGARVCLIEAGPSDEGRPEVLRLQRWPELLHTGYDYDYAIESQERGNSEIRQSRGRVLGGSGSHNICQAWQAPDADMREWESAGAAGWGPEGTRRHFERVFDRVGLGYNSPDNDIARAFVEAGEQAGYPVRDMAADASREGVGWVAINARDGLRRSSSVAYLHPLAQAPPNLTVLLDTQALRLVVDERGDARAVETTRGTLHAEREIVLACGAFDTPKLMMLSGIGPEEHLGERGIAVRADLPVGRHLLDHPEGGVIHRTIRPIHQPNTSYCDAVLLACAPGNESGRPDLMMWLFSGHFEDFTIRTDRSAPPSPDGVTTFSLAPDVTHSRSEGVVTLRSIDPADPPVIDPRYFSDPDGHDERMLVEGVKLARRIAARPALTAWIAEEIAPGPAVTDDDELSRYARATSYTAYHPAGTCRMGAADDPRSVVDPDLRVRGIGRLRVADASVFPSLPGVNPNITCMMVGEKCADLVRGRTGGPTARQEARR